MKTESSNVHILTLNVQGIRDRKKQKRMFEWSKQQKASVLFLQETHLTPDLLSNFEQQFKGTAVHSLGTSSSKGVAILIHSSVCHKVLNTYCDAYGRLIIVNVVIDTVTYTMVNIYAPNNQADRNIFFKQLLENITEHAEGTIILAGDYNEILDPKIDRKTRSNQIPKKTKASNSLGNLNREKGLIDIWRIKNKRKSQFTWKRQALNEASRIDYFLIQTELENNVISCDIRPAQISKTSHLAVSLKLKTCEENRGPGIWKINNSILNDNEYQTLIIHTIQNCKRIQHQENLTSHNTWEKIKLDIREVTQSFSKRKAKQVKSRCTLLENRLTSLHQLQDKTTEINENIKNEIINAETELDSIYENRAKGAQIRARAEWVEQGEKNTKFFLGLEKSRQRKKNIRKLTTTDGQTLTESTDILNEQVSFYSRLYSSKINDTAKMRNYIDSTRLSNTLLQTDKQLCDQNITIDECRDALFSMKLNKSPGSDGLSVEFYQTFWDQLGESFMNALNESILKGQLTNTQGDGILSLIFKSGDETSLSNWRPITLLNVDYKIIARVLAQRLQKVIAKIVSSDQNGYIKNRFIGFSIRQIQDIIDYAEECNLNGVLLFLDYQKAFDSIEWNFMNMTLEKFGFGNAFINLVKMLYKNANNKIVNNGWVSNSFEISRGIRQGCPISALLYILAAEIMAERIRHNDNIRGIKVGRSKIIKLTQMADDTTIFLESEHNIPILLNEIQRFSEVSGLILNKAKTKGLLLGRNRRNVHFIHGIDFSMSAIKSLGIYFSANTQESLQLNWNKLIEDIQNLLNSWKRRKLTLFGKITVLKTLAMSKCNYLLQCITVTNEIIAKIESLFFKFLWNDKPDKLKRKQLIQNYEKGGLRMIDIKTQLQTFQIKWVLRLISDNDTTWKIIPKFHFQKYGKNFALFKMNFGTEKNLKDIKLPNFYKNLITAWVNAGGGCTDEPKSFASIRKQILWGNQFIKWDRKCLLYKNWIDDNILYVNDIISPAGEIDTALILNKLQQKQNWISQIYKLRRAIPETWKNAIKSRASRETVVSTDTGFFLNDQINNKLFHFQTEDLVQNRQISNFIQNRNLVKPIMEKTWITQFNLSHQTNTGSLSINLY